MPRTVLHVDDRALPLAADADVDRLRAEIAAAANGPARFVDVEVATGTVAVLVTPRTRALVETQVVDGSSADDEAAEWDRALAVPLEDFDPYAAL